MAHTSQSTFQGTERTSCKFCTPPTHRKHNKMEVPNSNINVHAHEQTHKTTQCSYSLKMHVPSHDVCEPKRSDCYKSKTVYDITQTPVTNRRERHVSCLWIWSNAIPKPWKGFDAAKLDGSNIHKTNEGVGSTAVPKPWEGYGAAKLDGSNNIHETKGDVGSIQEGKKEESKRYRSSLHLADDILQSAKGIELEEPDVLGQNIEADKITMDSGIASLASLKTLD